MPATTPECLRRLADDTPQAWGDLLAEHGETLHHCCRRIAGSPLADDALQESLLHIRAAAERFAVPVGHDPEASARAWMRAIAANCALQLVRREQRLARRENVARAEAEPDGAKHDDPAAAAERQETAALVRRELAALPPAMRTAVALRHLEELPIEEVAAALECPVGTAKSLVHRGLERLRPRLERLRAAVGMASAVAALGLLTVEADAVGSPHAIAPPAPNARPRTAPPSKTHRLPIAPAIAIAALLLVLALAGSGLLLAGGTRPLPAATAAAGRQAPSSAGSASASPLLAAERSTTAAGRADGGGGDDPLLGPLPLDDARLTELLATTGATAASTVFMRSDDGTGDGTSYSVTERGGKAWLEVQRGGKSLFSGPVSTPAELAQVPEEIIAGAHGLGLDFDVQHRSTPEGKELRVRSGGGGKPAPVPQ